MLVTGHCEIKNERFVSECYVRAMASVAGHFGDFCVDGWCMY